MKDSKLAILSDIHSNIFALREVYKDAMAKGATSFVNLGDILYGPIEPLKTYEFLQEKEILTLCGNQDRILLEVTQEEIKENKTLEFVLHDLGKTPLEWLKTLPPSLHVNKDIYACHGTPRSDEEYLLEELHEAYVGIKSDEDIAMQLKEIDAKVILCGHSHKPNLIELSCGKLVLNPGSVGLPAYCDELPLKHSMQNYSSYASYALLNKNSFGYNVSFVKVAYDVQKALQCTQKNERLDWYEGLKTGRIKASEHC